MVVKRPGTTTDDSVVVLVLELEGTGGCVVAVAVAPELGTSLCFFVSGVEAEGVDTPELTDLLSLIVAAEVVGRVVVGCDFSLIVGEDEFSTVVEVASAKVELVVPSEGEFPTDGLEFGIVLLGNRCTEDGRQGVEGCQHVIGGTGVPVEDSGQTAVEHSEVNSEVDGLCSLPCVVGRLRGRIAGVRNLCALECP